MPTVSSSRTVTTTTAGSSSSTVHVISLRGLSGAMFWMIVIALILYVVAFATVGWGTFVGGSTTGLWQSCVVHSVSSRPEMGATQAMITLGLIALVIAFILVMLYMFVHTVSKSQTILGVVICCFLTVLFAFIGLMVFGLAVAPANISWSFVLCIIATVMCLVAGILATVQMRGGQC